MGSALFYMLLFGIPTFFVVFVVTLNYTMKRANGLNRNERQELAAARAALKQIEKDARAYQSDLLSDVILSSVEKYNYRELE